MAGYDLSCGVPVLQPPGARKIIVARVAMEKKTETGTNLKTDYINIAVRERRRRTALRRPEIYGRRPAARKAPVQFFAAPGQALELNVLGIASVYCGSGYRKAPANRKRPIPKSEQEVREPHHSCIERFVRNKRKSIERRQPRSTTHLPSAHVSSRTIAHILYNGMHPTRPHPSQVSMILIAQQAGTPIYKFVHAIRDAT